MRSIEAGVGRVGPGAGRVGTGVAVMALLAMAWTAWSPQTARAQAPGGGVVEIPLHLDPAGRLVVPVQTADGRTLNFAVSTMVPTSLVAASVAGADASALGLRLDGFDHPLEVAAQPDEVFVADGHRVDGFLGVAALGDVDVLLDAPNRRMLLRPIGRSVEWAGMTLSEPARLNVFHGVALRLDLEVAGRSLGATIDLANPANQANPGAAHAAGLTAAAPASVRIAGSDRLLRFDIADTPILDRWDPDGAGFISLGAPFAADCAVSLSLFHQELRTCVR